MYLKIHSEFWCSGFLESRRLEDNEGNGRIGQRLLLGKEVMGIGEDKTGSESCSFANFRLPDC